MRVRKVFASGTKGVGGGMCAAVALPCSVRRLRYGLMRQGKRKLGTEETLGFRVIMTGVFS